MSPLVSILIPAYNAEKWIKETLDSALNQDYPNIEIILVNDGSTDATLSIARRYESRGVRVLDQPNAGGPAARNAALSVSKGDFIQWLDHDDLLAPDKISQQLKGSHMSPGSRVLLSSSFGRFFLKPEEARFVESGLWKDLTPLEYFMIKFTENAFLQPSCWLVSRRLTELAGPWWELRSPDDDGEYFCRVAAASERIHFVAAAKCYWRIGNLRSLSHPASDAAFEALYSSLCRSIKHFRNLEDSDRSRTACVQYLQSQLLYFYPEKADIVTRMNALARELGGELCIPALSWKYRWIQLVFGYRLAKKAMLHLRWLRGTINMKWKQLLHTMTS